MAKWPLNPGQRRWLLDEMNQWRDAGIIQDDQIDAILRHYETDLDSPEPSLHAPSTITQIAVYILLSVAAFFVGLAVLLVVGFNWNEIPAWLKLAMIFFAVIGTHTLGGVLRFLFKAPVFSEIVFFLGCIFYGAGIFLIGQIFHINAHWPDGFLWWAIGILPFAFLLRTFLHHFLLAAILAIWVGSEILGFADFFRFHANAPWFELPHAAFLLPLFTTAGLLWGYRSQSPTAVALHLMVLLWWLFLQPVAWHWYENPILFYCAVGAWLMILAELHEAASTYAILYRLLGLLIACGTLVPLSFYWFNEHAFHPFANGQGQWFPPYVGQFLFILIGTIAVVASTLFVFYRRLENRETITQPIKDFAIRQWLPFGLVGLAMFHGFLRMVISHDAPGRGELEIAITVLINIVIVATAIWLISLGLHEDRGLPFAGGVAIFLIWAVMRYVDLFGGFGGMLGAACMFFLCGMTLAGVAAYWWLRRSRRRSYE